MNSLENRDGNLSGVCITNNKKLSKSLFYTNDINAERAESEIREKADAFFLTDLSEHVKNSLINTNNLLYPTF